MPRRKSTAFMAATSSSPTKTRPDCGTTSRFTVRKSVLFPQPDGPTKTVKLPAGISTLTPSTALRSARGYRTATDSKRTAFKPSRRQERTRDRGRVLFAHRIPVIHLREPLCGDFRRDCVERRRDLLMRAKSRVAHHRRNVVCGPEVAVVLEQHEPVFGDLRVGRKGGGDVGVAAHERVVLQADVVRFHILEFEAGVEFLQARQRVRARDELRHRSQPQLRRRARTGGKRSHAAGGNRFRDDQTLRIVRGRRRQPRHPVPFLILHAHALVQHLRVAYRLHVQHVNQAGAGIFRIYIDVAAFHRRHRDLRAAQIHVPLDGKSGAFEHPRIDFADDDVFAEIFGSYPNRAARAALCAAAVGQDKRGSDERKRSFACQHQTVSPMRRCKSASANSAHTAMHAIEMTPVHKRCASLACRPVVISSPSPPAPMNAASTALAITSVAAVRMPAKTTGKAAGHSTRSSVCVAVMPSPRAASIDARFTLRKATSVVMATGAAARMANAASAGAKPKPSTGIIKVSSARLGTARPTNVSAKTGVRVTCTCDAPTPSATPASAPKARAAAASAR